MVPLFMCGWCTKVVAVEGGGGVRVDVSAIDPHPYAS
jgi:hypothetical protein